MLQSNEISIFFVIFAKILSMSQFHTLVVSDIKRDTAKAVSINFSIPDNLKSDYKYIAGQYITLKTSLDGKEIRRDYSLCSSPNSGDLMVAVKEVEDGLFSKYANRNLNVGDRLEVSTPNGRFTFDADSSKSRHIVCFAAGSGITPILSIIKSVLEDEPNSSVSIMYGNKSIADTMFYDELSTLKEKYPERFNIQFVFSQAEENDSIFGRIDVGNSNYFVKNSLVSEEIDAYYLCGPEEMIYSINDLLKGQGVDHDKIKFELFKVKLEEDKDESDVAEGQTEITIMLDDEETTFIMDAKDSVLDAALARDIDAPYSCQGGICSSCLARVTEGEVKMRQNNILTDSEVAEGLVLTCQSHPLTSKVYIDYDDV
ncbi:ring-1,2-phenylacetyl-CoA epoxidase subunit PaaE [Flavobacteriaceae bacterium MAR_2010_188]|nr:ring-1,2-phenylacetyl-CoA epoxidase subunit PaaE [Flavobacteriaceae bacterium MAR_2010_188]